MSKDTLVLRLEQPCQREFYIEGSTQLGRALDTEWKVQGRATPEEFSGLEVAIVIMDSAVSRNHAAIIRDKNGFYLMDLNSSNGTRLNEENINPTQQSSAKAYLREGDVFSLAGAAHFTVKEYRTSDKNNYAVLACHNGSDIIGVEESIEAVGEALQKRKFQNEGIRKLHTAEAKKRNIEQSLKEIEYKATPNSTTIFYYAGHGDIYEGLVLGAEQLPPEELYRMFRNIRGYKAIILDCCHAGAFVSSSQKAQIPSDTLVIAATTAEGKAFYSPRHVNEKRQGQYMGRFTAALVEALNATKDRVRLKELVLSLKERFPDAFYSKTFNETQEPQANGMSSFIISAQAP